MNDAAILTKSDEPFNAVPGMLLYHTTTHGVTFKRFAEQTTWYTPFMDQVVGYRNNDDANSVTLVCEWLGGKIAQDSDILPIIYKVWPYEKPGHPDYDEDSCPLSTVYSRLDPIIREYEKEEIEKFVRLIKEAGFVGVCHSDYDSNDSNKDSFSLAVFEPNKHTRILRELKV